MRIRVTLDELDLIIAALDSHEYWELSGADERNNGASLIEDEEACDCEDDDEECRHRQVDALRLLMQKLEAHKKKEEPSARPAPNAAV